MWKYRNSPTGINILMHLFVYLKNIDINIDIMEHYRHRSVIYSKFHLATNIKMPTFNFILYAMKTREITYLLRLYTCIYLLGEIYIARSHQRIKSRHGRTDNQSFSRTTNEHWGDERRQNRNVIKRVNNPYRTNSVKWIKELTRVRTSAIVEEGTPTKGIGVNYVEPRFALSSSCLARSSRATMEGESLAEDPR